MRVGMIPENPVEWVLNQANVIPFPVADTFVAMIQARTIMAAARLGVFAALSNGPATVLDLARKLSCKERGIKALLDALVGCGYAVESQGRYRLSRRARKWLGTDSPHSIIHYINFKYYTWDWLGRLEEAVQSGMGLDLHHRLLDIEGWRSYLYGLHELSRMAAKEMLLRFRLKRSDKRLLDIGGGPGAYTAAYCRRYPNLRAVIFDLPQAVNVGKEIIGKKYQDVADRIEFVQGDLLKDPFGGGYDVVFLFNVIHHFSHQENRQTFKKVYDALNPGGTFVILDQLKQATRADSYLAVLTQLMFLMTSRSESHGLDDVRHWLREIGFSDVRSKGLLIGPGTSFVTATKK